MNNRLRNVSILVVSLLACLAPERAGQESTPADQTTPNALEIRVTEVPKWRGGCLHVSYDVVNQTANTLWLPINGSYVSAGVRIKARGHGRSGKDDWVSMTPFFDSDPSGAVPMPTEPIDHHELCLRRTFHVTKGPGGRGRDIPVRAQIQIVIEYFLTEQDWRTNEAQRDVIMRKKESEWKRLEAEMLRPHSTSVVLSVPCYPGKRASECTQRPILKDGEGIWVP
jgi:hypothetical protein